MARTAAKTSPKGEQTRQAILDQAVDLASTEGLDGVSIGTLAKAVGMSKSGLFAHFRSKEALQLAVLSTTAERFVAKVVAPALRERRGEPRIRAIFERWLRWDREEFPGGCVFHMAAAELDDRPGPVRDFLVQTQRDWGDTVHTAVRIAIEEGHFRPDLDPAQFAFELFGMGLSYHRHCRLLRTGDAEKRATTAFEALLERSRT